MTSPAQKEVLFFDLDGTVIDSYAGITSCIRWTLQQLDVSAPSATELRGWIGPALRTSFAPLLNHDSARAEAAVALYLQRFDSHGWRDYRIYAGIDTLIAACQAAGKRLAIVSAKNEPHAQRIVAHLPFGSAFETVVGSIANGSRTHKPELIAEALQRMQVTADQCVMIGDRKMDMEGAQVHAMRRIGVLWGFGSAEELHAAGAEHLAQTPEVLMQLLLRD